MSVAGDFGPAPPGVDLTENQDRETYSAVITLTILATFTVGIRLVSRCIRAGIYLAVDDFLIVAALVYIQVPYEVFYY